MEDGLPDNVRDFKLDTRFINRREVAHLYDDPDAPPSSPRREEYWKKEKRIGGGGQGEVHLQKCTSGGRTYTHRAVKVIPIRESGIKRRFLRELETITKFSHPRVRGCGDPVSRDSEAVQ
jgi:serine/threonine protein kinase